MAQEKGKLTREFSAGGAVFRGENDRVEWLLIKPAGTGRWQLPKGNIDEGERSEQTALREVFEETGVKARIVCKLAAIGYFYSWQKARIFKTVTFFLMEYEEGKEGVQKGFENEIDAVSWFATQEALEKLTHASEKEILAKGQKVLESGTQERLV